MEKIAEELEAIKKLMVFTLLWQGATQEQIGSALGIDRSQVSRMFPKGLKFKQRET
ncbi:helix-turn-helix domain-containing protein [Hyphomicrobium sp.]|uniref:helix-turn-helix domain-containing protein n=1 Tax=Hyphomicrobium sp. TaxID=82 RepID=UPI0025BE4CF0|nr:helix-turn-helix domain-containing protein [Hyphomicrobium sp.]